MIQLCKITKQSKLKLAQIDESSTEIAGLLQVRHDRPAGFKNGTDLMHLSISHFVNAHFHLMGNINKQRI